MTRRQASLPPLFPLSVLKPASSRRADTAPAATSSSPGSSKDLAAWAAAHPAPPARVVAGGLRFAFYWRCSTEDNQDPVTSRATQRGRALATIAGEGCVVVEFSDIGYSRSVSPFLRPGMAAQLAALADPDRDFDAVVVGSHERAFFGNQYSLVSPLLAMNGVQLWMPEFGGRVDPAFDNVEDLMAMLGAWHAVRSSGLGIASSMP
jgi:site-specific DNA recombinase